MPVTFDQLVGVVNDEVRPELEPDDAYPGISAIECIVRATLKRLDLHVNSNTGEVYSPAPKPSIVFSGVRQSGVHYKGQRRRRGYRR